MRPNIANMHKTCYVFFSMVCARLVFFYFFIFIFSPRRSRRGTLGISSPGGPVEEPLKSFCSFFSLRRLSSSVVFQWGSLRQTLDLSKTTNEKVPWRRHSSFGGNCRNVFLRVSGMHEIMCVAGPNVPWKMDGVALPRDGCKTVPAVPGSWSDQNRSVATASGVVLHNLSFNI